MSDQESGYRQSYKYRIYPTAEQQEIMNQNFGCCRFVYNYYLRQRINAYERTQETLRRPKIVPGTEDDEKPEYVRDQNNHVVYEDVANKNYDPAAKPMSMFDTSKDLTKLKKELVDEDGHAWLKDADAVALIYSLRNLDAAYQNFFRGIKRGQNIGFPRFKSKNDSHQAYKTKPKAVIELNKETGELVVAAFSLPKIGVVKTKVHRQPEGDIVAASVSRTPSGKWYLSVNVKGVEKSSLPSSFKEVGLTYGISTWVSGSDGSKFDLPEQLKRLEKRLAREQKKLSRMEVGSNNFRKQKLRVARANERLANVRADATHKLTKGLVDEYGMIASREMSTQDMMQHQGAATKDLPRKVQEYMNRQFANGNFFEINRQLAYKSEWAGRAFALVDGKTPTAQVCKDCGYVAEELIADLKPEWVCPECGAVHSRKYNGAVNVLEAGKDQLRKTEDSYVSKAKKAKESKGK